MVFVLPCLFSGSTFLCDCVVLLIRPSLPVQWYNYSTFLCDCVVLLSCHCVVFILPRLFLCDCVVLFSCHCVVFVLPSQFCLFSGSTLCDCVVLLSCHCGIRPPSSVVVLSCATVSYCVPLCGIRCSFSFLVTVIVLSCHCLFGSVRPFHATVSYCLPVSVFMFFLAVLFYAARRSCFFHLVCHCVCGIGLPQCGIRSSSLPVCFLH